MTHKNQTQLRPTSARQLDIYRVALALIEACRPLHPRITRFNRREGAQLYESLTSIPKNLSEGMRRTGKDRAHLLTVMLGSTDEVRAILDSALAFGVINHREHKTPDTLADRIGAMGYRLRKKNC